MTEQRNDGLHPRHPGRGKCAVIELESDDGKPEIGGFLLFLPSGATRIVNWTTAKPITPTLEAAQQYATDAVETIIKAQGLGHMDVQRVNWTSVTAAIQRVIMDFNHKLVGRINAKMVRDLALPNRLH